VSERGTRPVEHTAQVHAQHLGHHLVGRGRDEPRQAVPRVVVEHVELAETLDRAFDQGVDGGGITHAGRVRDRVTTRGPDQFDGRTRGLGVDVVDDDARAVGCESHRTGPTDPRPGPGDDHDLACELPRHHARRLSPRQNAAMRDELRFDGRVVAITGAHHGLGRANLVPMPPRAAKALVAFRKEQLGVLLHLAQVRDGSVVKEAGRGEDGRRDCIVLEPAVAYEPLLAIFQLVYQQLPEPRDDVGLG
jgi:hypothetical protein